MAAAHLLDAGVAGQAELAFAGRRDVEPTTPPGTASTAVSRAPGCRTASHGGSPRARRRPVGRDAARRRGREPQQRRPHRSCPSPSGAGARLRRRRPEPAGAEQAFRRERRRNGAPPAARLAGCRSPPMPGIHGRAEHRRGAAAGRRRARTGHRRERPAWTGSKNQGARDVRRGSAGASAATATRAARRRHDAGAAVRGAPARPTPSGRSRRPPVRSPRVAVPTRLGAVARRKRHAAVTRARARGGSAADAGDRGDCRSSARSSCAAATPRRPTSAVAARRRSRARAR